MSVANVGWDLAGSTGGRFVIGLGSQVRAHNERRFSVAWTPPAPRMREYVQVLRNLAMLEDRRKTRIRRAALPFYLDDTQFRARANRRAAAGGHDRGSRSGDAKGRRRRMRR